MVVVYDQNLLSPRALVVCEPRGDSLEMVVAAAAPGRGPMRPLLSFLKDRPTTLTPEGFLGFETGCLFFLLGT